MNTTKIKDKLKTRAKFRKTKIAKKLDYYIAVTYDLMIEMGIFFVGFLVAIAIIPLNLDKILVYNTLFVGRMTAILSIYLMIITVLVGILIINIITYFTERRRWLRGLK